MACAAITPLGPHYETTSGSDRGKYNERRQREILCAYAAQANAGQFLFLRVLQQVEPITVAALRFQPVPRPALPGEEGVVNRVGD